MEIRVLGFLYESTDDTSNHELHSHQLYITSWDGKPLHSHKISGVTSFDAGHNHKYAGMTEPAPSGVPHKHKYFTITSFDNGHRHKIKGVTGPAIPLPGGGHYHKFSGVTSRDGDPPHTHKYFGKTSP